jgi:hypothetical protein
MNKVKLFKKKKEAKMKLKICFIVGVLMYLMAPVNAAEVFFEDFSGYSDNSFLGLDALNPETTGWYYAGQNEGVDDCVSLPVGGDYPMPIAPGGTASAYQVIFGSSSSEKDTNIGWISSTLTYKAGYDYKLTFKLGVSNGLSDDINCLMMATVDGTAVSVKAVDPKPLFISPSDGWLSYSVTATAADIAALGAVGSGLQLQFNIDGDQTGTEGGDIVYLTDVRIEEIPEPATILLLSLGSLVLVRRRR